MEFLSAPMRSRRRNRLSLGMLMLPLLIFTVVSCGGGGGGDSPAPVPTAPKGVKATAGHGEVTITWDNVTGATSYNLYYSTLEGVTKVTGDRLKGVGNPYRFTGLVNGTTYHFVVTAVNPAGEGPISSEVSSTPTPSPPPAPKNVVPNPGHGAITISWDNVTGVTSYNIYYDSATPVTKSTADNVIGATSPKVINGLINGTTYYFAVTSVNANGESVFSGEVSATPTPPPPPPAKPTGVTAMAGPGQATISWSPVAGASSYNLYRATTAGVDKATGFQIPNVASPRVVDSLSAGTKYYFVVTAENGNGESPESDEVFATPYVEYVAFGDSITFGDGDDYAFDDTSIDGRNTGGGFEPILNNLLTSEKGIPHSIANEGWEGFRASGGWSVLPAVLANHPNATYYLILFGTNDSDPSSPTPSGLGLSSGQPGYNNSYKDYMQRMVTAIKGAGKIPYLAKVPYSKDVGRNPNIQEFNQVIGELVAANGITVAPPDLYGWFESHQDQLFDLLHPNGIGYQSMAQRWQIALP